MQICDCFVRLGGNLNHEVQKKGVTVAEIAVLRAIHGQDAVVKVTPVRMDKRPHREELNRLRERYKSRAKLIGELFPGHSPNLPTTLKDVGLEHPAKGGKSRDAQASDAANGGGGGSGEGGSGEGGGVA